MDVNKPDDPEYCQNLSFLDRITKCKQHHIGNEICAGTCGYCPLPPSPPPPEFDAPPSPPPPKPPCATPIDFVLLLDESGSMKNIMEGPEGLKAFAKQLVSQYFLGVNAARFSVVSFAETAKTRVRWSDDEGVINAGIEAMSADGKTSISGGFEVARELFDDDGNGTRTDAAKIVLFVSDGEQSELFAALDRTPHETALDAATLVKDLPATVFAWGFGNKVSKRTLEQIATDESKVVLGQNVSELMSHLGMLQDAACAASPPSNPSPPPSTEEVVLTMKLEASGTVDTDSIQTIVAGIAGVAPSAVTIEIKSSRLRRGLNEVTVPDGSVIVATIAVPASTTAAAVQESLSLLLSSAAAASNALGINVEVVSIVTTASSPLPSPLPLPLVAVPLPLPVTAAAHVDSSVTIIGGAATIAALLALLLFASR